LKNLAGISLLALLLGGVFALLVQMSMNARSVGSRGQPTSPASAVWVTGWERDDVSLQSRGALSTADGEAPPILLGQTLYALGSDRQLHALDPQTGNQIWRYDAGGVRRVYNFRASSSRLVMLLRAPNLATSYAESFLVGVDTTTHNVVWDLVLGADVYVNSLEIDGDSAYIAVADDVNGTLWRPLRDRKLAFSLHPRVRAYSLADGFVRWDQAVPERSGGRPADDIRLVVLDREVIASESTGTAPDGLAGLNRNNGGIAWADVNGSQPALALGSLRGEIVARAGPDLMLLAPDTGRALERLGGLAPPRLSDAVTLSAAVLYSAGFDQVRAVDIDQRAAPWAPVPLDAPRDSSAGGGMRRPSVRNGHLLVGGRDLGIYSIKVLSGAVEWKFIAPPRTQQSTDYAPLRVGNLVLVQDGQLTAYSIPQ
jgi:outer membrane protein assembly factor BamB